MNDGMYTNLRNYLEEQSSLLRQILEELKAQGKMENARIRNAVEKNLERWNESEAVGPVTQETVTEKPLKTTETVQTFDTPNIDDKAHTGKTDSKATIKKAK